MFVPDGTRVHVVNNVSTEALSENLKRLRQEMHNVHTALNNNLCIYVIQFHKTIKKKTISGELTEGSR